MDNKRSGTSQGSETKRLKIRPPPTVLPPISSSFKGPLPTSAAQTVRSPPYNVHHSQVLTLGQQPGLDDLKIYDRVVGSGDVTVVKGSMVSLIFTAKLESSGEVFAQNNVENLVRSFQDGSDG